MQIQTIVTVAAAIPLAIALIAWLSAVMIAHSRDNVEHCPFCSSSRVRRSWPKTVDNLVGVAAVAAFRCEGCCKRFYARRTSAGDVRLCRYTRAI